MKCFNCKILTHTHITYHTHHPLLILLPRASLLHLPGFSRPLWLLPPSLASPALPGFSHTSLASPSPLWDFSTFMSLTSWLCSWEKTLSSDLVCIAWHDDLLFTPFPLQIAWFGFMLCEAESPPCPLIPWSARRLIPCTGNCEQGWDKHGYGGISIMCWTNSLEYSLINSFGTMSCRAGS